MHSNKVEPASYPPGSVVGGDELQAPPAYAYDQGQDSAMQSTSIAVTQQPRMIVVNPIQVSRFFHLNNRVWNSYVLNFIMRLNFLHSSSLY